MGASPSSTTRRYSAAGPWNCTSEVKRAPGHRATMVGGTGAVDTATASEAGRTLEAKSDMGFTGGGLQSGRGIRTEQKARLRAGERMVSNDCRHGNSAGWVR